MQHKNKKSLSDSNNQVIKMTKTDEEIHTAESPPDITSMYLETCKLCMESLLPEATVLTTALPYHPHSIC